jgi:DNA-binding SARP family transcriptional activator
VLGISLFGGFYLTLDGHRLTSPISDKALALLARLVIEPHRSHRRTSLAAVLWPTQSEDAALANLRQTLHRLLQALGQPPDGPPYLLITRQDIQFNLQSRVSIDVVEFIRLLRTSQEHHNGNLLPCLSCLENLLEAIALYQGDFLEGVSLNNCLHMEYWLTCKREEYHQQMIDVLTTLVTHFELAENTARALHFAQKAIELEPWSESLHRRKMLLFARDNQRNAALLQYKTCRQILALEWGLEPERETIDLYHQISAGL